MSISHESIEKSCKMNRIRFVVYLLGTLVWVWIALNLPYTWDDISWGTSGGITDFLTGRQNSRYAGNLLIIVMTRSQIAKTVILSAVYALIPIAMVRLADTFLNLGDIEIIQTYCTADLLLLLTTRPVWQQTYGWVAGATNYVISFLLLLVYIGTILRDLESVSQCSWRKAIGLFLFGIAIQLFLEHLALITTAVSTCMLVHCLIRKKQAKSFWALASGNLLGLGIAFCNTVYKTLFQTGMAFDSYRQFVFSLDDSFTVKAEKTFIQFLGKYVPALYESYGFLPLCVAVITMCILLLCTKRRKWMCRTLALAELSILLYMMTVKWGCVSVPFAESRYRYLFYRLITSDLLAVLGIISVWLIFESKVNRIQCFTLMGIWVCAPALLAPLSATTESSPRVFFTSVGLLVFMAVVLLAELAKCFSKKMQSLLLTLLAAGLAVQMFILCSVYLEIGQTTRRRMAAMEAVRSGQSQLLHLEQYAHWRYLWYPQGMHSIEEYRDFYHLPNDVDIIFDIDSLEYDFYEN